MDEDNQDKLAERLPESGTKPAKGLKDQPLAQRMQIPPWVVREARHAETEQAEAVGKRPFQFVADLISWFK